MKRLRSHSGAMVLLQQVKFQTAAEVGGSSASSSSWQSQQQGEGKQPECDAPALETPAADGCTRQVYACSVQPPGCVCPPLGQWVAPVALCVCPEQASACVTVLSVYAACRSNVSALCGPLHVPSHCAACMCALCSGALCPPVRLRLFVSCP